jgi:Tetracyclin repressor-like, C-terminal domain
VENDTSSNTLTVSFVFGCLRTFHFSIRLIGLPGKIVAELIAEGQSEPEVLRSLFDQQIRARRGAIAADIERGKENGELHPDADPELLIYTIFGATPFNSNTVKTQARP